MKKKVMFISSGGGHLTELLRLEPLFKQVHAIFVLEKQEYPFDLTADVVYLPKGTRKHKIRYFFIFFWLCVKSIVYYLKYRPDMIITTGAYTAVPLCFLASFFKKEIIFIESIARVHSKSLTGKLIEKRCTHILVQWESMRTLYPESVYCGQIL